jgi:hypothetical protein
MRNDTSGMRRYKLDAASQYTHSLMRRIISPSPVGSFPLAEVAVVGDTSRDPSPSARRSARTGARRRRRRGGVAVVVHL